MLPCNIRATAAISTWLVLNVILQLLNKVLICSGVRLPVLVITTGTMVTLVALGLFQSRKVWVDFKAQKRAALSSFELHSVGRKQGRQARPGRTTTNSTPNTTGDGFSREGADLLITATGEVQPSHRRKLTYSNPPTTFLDAAIEAAAPYLAQRRLVFIIGATHGLATALENMSIVEINISTNQVIKACAPVLTLFATLLWPSSAASASVPEERVPAADIERIYAGETPLALRFSSLPLGLRATTLIVVAGAILAVFRSPDWNVLGVGLAVASLFIGVWQVLLTERLLQRTGDLSSPGLAAAAALPALVILIPLAAYLEGSKIVSGVPGDRTCHDMKLMEMGEAISIIAVLGVIACLYNLAHFFMLEYTSAHYVMITGNAKVIIVILVAEMFLPSGVLEASNASRSVNIFGFVLTIVGYCLYNFLLVRYKSQGMVR